MGYISTVSGHLAFVARNGTPQGLPQENLEDLQHLDALAFFFTLTPEELVASGARGVFRDPQATFEALVATVNEADFMVLGSLSVAGEELGDVTLYTFTAQEPYLVSEALALAWQDGCVPRSFL